MRNPIFLFLFHCHYLHRFPDMQTRAHSADESEISTSYQELLPSSDKGSIYAYRALQRRAAIWTQSVSTPSSEDFFTDRSLQQLYDHYSITDWSSRDYREKKRYFSRLWTRWDILVRPTRTIPIMHRYKPSRYDRLMAQHNYALMGTSNQLITTMH